MVKKDGLFETKNLLTGLKGTLTSVLTGLVTIVFFAGASLVTQLVPIVGAILGLGIFVLSLYVWGYIWDRLKF